MLTQSKEFILEPNEEIRIDLKLKRKLYPPRNKITGIVSCNGHPVPRATVKVLDYEYNPVTHAKTNEAGIYLIENLKPDEYKLTASAPGFLVANIIDFSLTFNESKTINVTIKKDKLAQENGFIYGTIIELLTEKVINNAKIQLSCSTSPHPFIEVSSNESGQFMFCTIPPGEYFAVASKKGFCPSDPIKIIVAAGSRIKVCFLLQANNSTQAGTVSGIIMDHFGKELAGVYVGLFQVDQDEELLIEIKITNGEGLYLFTDVSSGKYMVKAKIQEKWELAKEFHVL